MYFIVAPKIESENEDAFDKDIAVLKAHIAREGSSSDLRARVYPVNLGLGADWVVSAIEILTWVSLASLAVPELHKRIRESIDECRHMYAELQLVIDKLRGERRVIQYPLEAMYLVALEEVLRSSASEEVRLICNDPIPIDPALSNGFIDTKHHLFIFQVGIALVLIAVDARCHLLWKKQVSPVATSND